MKLYNTMSKEFETVKSMSNTNTVGLYACGPTVYDGAHLGHLRKYSLDDVLIRVLRHEGLSVNHVMNVTDVGHLVSDADTGEDKMEKGARRTGMSVWEVAKKYEEFFWYSLDRMGLERPTVSCRATEHIAEQIEQVQQLEAKGFTYVIDGDGVYFDTAQDPHYGELARLDLSGLQEGARIGVTDGKRNPSDFALWKFSPLDQKRQMEWDSPWGVGFPGWHIECSAMAMKYLGDQFEIHTGGIDHVPVHHTNEIAQAENASGKRPFVQIWVHHNFLRVDGQKMSKSLNNFYTIDDVLERGVSPMGLKMLILSAHYRDELNFTWESLAAAQKGYEKLQRKVWALVQAAGVESLADLPESDWQKNAHPAVSAFWEYLADDLKTPQAVAQLWTLLKRATPADLPALRQMLAVLGIDLS